MKNAVIIPSLNPNKKLIKLVNDLNELGLKNIVIINDGSAHSYDEIYDECKKIGCFLVTYEINRGKGYALKEGYKYVLENLEDVEYVVTADSDGQHLPKDIKRVCDMLDTENDKVVIGVRNFKAKDVPFRSRLGNNFSSMFFRIFTGRLCSDTQTGLRGIPRKHLSKALEIEGNRYEYEMNFLMDLAIKKIDVIEVPIATVYEDNNKESHFRPIVDSIRIYNKPLKFLTVGLISAIFDITLFKVLFSLNIALLGIVLSTIIARISSGILNFILNKFWCFKSKGVFIKQAFKYILLFICQMMMSAILVYGMSKLIDYPTIIKIFVDAILFIFSYLIQRKYIFVNK